ncbi:uncharacterized protein LOC143536165 [Bidens hawaiensis]|uniref:uncharacterized protein LOC143536165 n=1 Tax=Bidens hawaiensis TaxID=980011 RepID=UPI004049CBAA
MGDQQAKETNPNPNSFQCPKLSTTNYTVWAMHMRVLMNVHGVWDTIDPGNDDAKQNNIAIALIFQSTPEAQILQVGNPRTAKEMWEALKTRHLGAERVKEAKLQTLTSEFDGLKMNETGTIDEYAATLLSYSSKVATPERYSRKKKWCDEFGHFVSRCPDRFRKDEVNLNRTEENETNGLDASFFMMEGVREAVYLNEDKVILTKYDTDSGETDMWHLDNGASNHMTGNREYFEELNEQIVGRVRFGDGSCVPIKGKGSIVFKGKSGEHKLMTNIYYIPGLQCNVISLGQAIESGCDIRMRSNYLTMHDSSGRLLMKVTRNTKMLYKI